VRPFTQEERRKIVCLYKEGLSAKDISGIIGRHVNSVGRVLRQEGVYIRRNDQPAYVPTPEEIREAADRISSSWDDKERDRRAGHEKRIPWMPPVVESPETQMSRAGRACGN
jgi:transposase